MVIERVYVGEIHLLLWSFALRPTNWRRMIQWRLLKFTTMRPFWPHPALINIWRYDLIGSGLLTGVTVCLFQVFNLDGEVIAHHKHYTNFLGGMWVWDGTGVGNSNSWFHFCLSQPNQRLLAQQLAWHSILFVHFWHLAVMKRWFQFMLHLRDSLRYGVGDGGLCCIYVDRCCASI